MFHFQSNRQNGRAAFTLIELLVVIAIIAILAAILFPVFARARENARRSSCQSNMKQIALAFKQYTQDYDERFPLRSGSTGATGRPFWAEVIQPYLQSQQILQCPSESSGIDPNPLSNKFTDYAYNLGLARGNGGTVNIGANESQLQFPTLTLLMVEVQTTNDGGSDPNMGTAYGSHRGAGGIDLANTNNLAWERHLLGSNFPFADGHVKWYRGPGNGGTLSPKVYAVNALFKVSQESPTFHVDDSFGGGTNNVGF